MRSDWLGTFTPSKSTRIIMLFRNGLTILLVVIGMRSFSATTEEQRKAAWQLSATYKGDFASNFNGGIKTGSTYLGLADLFMSFNPEQMGWWKKSKWKAGPIPVPQQRTSDIPRGIRTFQ